jgi:chromosome segregation ATPase
MKMETKFGKALYAILCAASPKLAADSALKPLVIGLTRKQCDLRALEPKLLAMDAELRKPETLAAMQAAKDAESEEETEAEKKAREEKEKAAKDKKAKDGKRGKDESFEEWAKEEEDESDHKAKDAEEESEEESEEERKERLEKRAKDKKAKDCSAKDEEEKAEDKMKHAMDEFKADLRAADEARRAVRTVVGDVLAQDSAEGIYSFALDQMKVDHKDVVGVPALRALFNLAQQASKPAVRQAFDAVSVEEKFTGAGRQIQVM